MGESIGFNSSKDSDGWDWVWFRYGSTVILNRTDNNWMQLTPREFNSLMRIHIEINDPKSKKEDKLKHIDDVL